MTDLTRDNGQGAKTHAFLAGLTYLIIDDNRFARILMRAALAGFGLKHVIEAEDAVEGLALLRKLPIDVVLVDYEMPIVNGCEFTRLARRDDGVLNPELPIVMVSGHCDWRCVVAARDAGVHEYLAKPFSADDLFRRVAMAVLKPRPFIRSKTYVGPERRSVKTTPLPVLVDRRQGTVTQAPVLDPIACVA
ncbi:MAG: response regulator [Magnetospirillum sp. WYHS-4]